MTQAAFILFSVILFPEDRLYIRKVFEPVLFFIMNTIDLPHFGPSIFLVLATYTTSQTWAMEHT